MLADLITAGVKVLRPLLEQLGLATVEIPRYSEVGCRNPPMVRK